MNCEAGLAGGGGVGYDKIAGLYDLLDTLGSGHFAVVKLARHVFTGEKVAVKVIDKSKLDEVSRSHLYQEVRCMKLVQHPNVVRLYEVIDTHTKLYLILELGDGGDLYDYIMRHESGLSESLARDYFRQIVRAISYCHRLHVVHRDLKPENVVFFERLGVVKLTDFGFSNKFNPGQKLETSCGSLAYSAPEILLGDSYDAPAVDVWSLGVILFMLVCGQAPFQEANDSETLTMIMDCKYTISPHISNSCKRLIGRMLVREPEKRATLLEIASDPWVTAGGKPIIDDYDTPLVAREQLSEDDRALIVQKMVNGAIGTKEQILEALDKNEYNHLTATYYLFAERKLKCKRREESCLARRPAELCVRAQTTNLLAPPTIQPAARTPQDVPPRSRKCSIVREEEDDEESGERTCTVAASARRGSRSEGRLCLAARHTPPTVPAQPPALLADNLTKVNLEDKKLSLAPRPALIPTIEVVEHYPSRLSTVPPPAEGPSPPVPPIPPTSLVPPVPPAPPRRHRLESRRRRAGSCSSSDLSDDDSETRKKRGNPEHDDVPPERARRDSREDPGGGGAPGGGGRGPPGEAGGAAPTPEGAGRTHEARGGPGGGTGGGRRRRAARHESRLRESRSLNRIAEVEESRAAGPGPGPARGLVALCGRPFLRLLARVPPAAQRRLHGLC